MESVAFVSLFSVLFMAIYQPFSVTTWFGFSSLYTFVITLLFYIVGVSTLIISKFLLLRYQKKKANCHNKNICTLDTWRILCNSR